MSEQVTELGPAPVEKAEDKSLETVVFESLGAVSACWDTLEGAGVFQSEKAKAIGDDLVTYIKGLMSEQEMRVLALQVAANRCEDVADLLKFAAECEAYLINGTVPQAE